MTFHSECMYVNTLIAAGNYSNFMQYKNIGYKGVHIQYPCKSYYIITALEEMKVWIKQYNQG
jgi:hypothetical protein